MLFLFERLEVLSNLKSEINGALYIMEKEIKKLILELKLVDDVNLSKSYFLSLFELQDNLSIVKYKYNYSMNDFLLDFIYYFDRQDEESIQYLFYAIKNDEILSF